MMTKRDAERNEREQRSSEGGADGHLIERFARFETERDRRARIARKRIDPEQAAAIARWAA